MASAWHWHLYTVATTVSLSLSRCLRELVELTKRKSARGDCSTSVVPPQNALEEAGRALCAQCQPASSPVSQIYQIVKEPLALLPSPSKLPQGSKYCVGGGGQGR